MHGAGYAWQVRVACTGRANRCLSRRTSGEVGQVVDAQASGDLSQARAAGGEESAQEVTLAKFIEPGPPAFGARADSFEDACELG